MNYQKIKLLLIGAGLFSSLSIKSQLQGAMINFKSSTFHGVTDTVDKAPILVNINGNVVMSGNQKMNATQYDAITAAQTASGVNVWQNSFSAGYKTFVTASTNDAMGNVYTVGGVVTSTANGLDFFLIKADPLGTVLFTNYYNGPNSTSDVASAVYVDDATGNIYVTGASEGAFPALIDYCTIMYDQTGSQQWCSRYNYSNSFDVPTSISLDVSSNNIFVSGSSGSTFSDWDFCVVSYDANNGSQLSVARTTNTLGTGQDKIFGMVTDSLGFIYSVGTTYNGSSYDVQLTKLDTALNTVYVRKFDGHGLDDCGISVALDDSLNIYVTGSSFFSTTNRELFLLKYNNAGALQWASKKQPIPHTSDAEGLKVVVKSYNEIFVGGNFTSNGNQDVAILRYNRSGQQTIEKTYDGYGQKDKFMDFTLSGNYIYVSARTCTSSTSSVDNNLTLKYEYKNCTATATTNTSTGVSYLAKEVLIDFHTSALKMAAINNRNTVFGQLNDFVQDSTCNKINSQLLALTGHGYDSQTFDTRKIFVNYTSSDTISETRLGTYVKIPEFYATLLIALPTGISTIDVADSVSKIKPDIASSQLNYLYELNWAPSDTLYNFLQSSLHTTTLYPNSHINCEPAWNFSKGDPNVRVGVYDTGVNGNHIDFGNSVVGGYDYVFTQTNGNNDSNSHGTAVSGIIAATSNNTTGVAGIAGGDGTNPGVSVYNMKIINGNVVPSSTLAVAYADGATGTNVAIGMAFHVMNHSYGLVNVATDPAMLRGLNYCNRNGVAFVASRGNHGANTYTNAIPPNAPNLPATLNPGLVMNVGATGFDGHYKKINVNGVSNSSGIGLNLDFVAPGADENVQTLAAGGSTISPLFTAPSGYRTFNSTSSAAAHVTGVSSLMMSYRNQTTPSWDNIVHEDCEAILKSTATDLIDITNTYSETPFYDSITGWGRINAGLALSGLQPQYKIRHIDANHYATSTSTSAVTMASNTAMYWPNTANGTLTAGYYNVEIIKLTTVYNYNFSTEVLLGKWPLYMASYGTPYITGVLPTLRLDEPAYVELLTATTTSASLQTYIYKILSQAAAPSQTYTNLYLPYSPNQINSAFTLYTTGSDVVGLQQPETEIKYFNVYPNPSNGYFTLAFASKKESKSTITVMDIMGRNVYQNENHLVKTGINEFDIELGNLPKGIYFINLDIESNKTMVKKIIIN